MMPGELTIYYQLHARGRRRSEQAARQERGRVCRTSGAIWHLGALDSGVLAALVVYGVRLNRMSSASSQEMPQAPSC